MLLFCRDKARLKHFLVSVIVWFYNFIFFALRRDRSRPVPTSFNHHYSIHHCNPFHSNPFHSNHHSNHHSNPFHSNPFHSNHHSNHHSNPFHSNPFHSNHHLIIIIPIIIPILFIPILFIPILIILKKDDIKKFALNNSFLYVCIE